MSIESSPSGETLTIGLAASNQEQQLLSRTRFTAFIRGRRERENPAQSASPATSTTLRAPLMAVSQTMDLDQTMRYAEASGDRNPIHLDPAVARMAGLPGIVVHGLCTMAFSSKVVIDNLCGRDPARLKRLAVVFSRPVFPGDKITTTIWRGDGRGGRTCYAYEACNSSGVAVLRDGIAEIL
jgi:acyl dehydratase